LPEVGFVREVFEETGLRDANVGPKIWRPQIAFSWVGVDYLQAETFFLIQCPRFTSTMEFNPAIEERAAFREFRCWSIQEIRISKDTFAPKRLAELLYDLTRKGPGAEVIDTGE
jgi:hypothetical protein